MRQIILDTETTGLNPADGHRIIEIGCVEMIDRRLTENRFHVYINPDREIDEGAIEVHGITNEFLVDRPQFKDITEDFLAFINESELVIHNAPFDLGFLDSEFNLLGSGCKSIQTICSVVDSLVLARKKHPGQRNSLDALCKRYGIDNSHRDLHGALLDAEILADVYLMMTGGQTSLLLDDQDAQEARGSIQIRRLPKDRLRLKVICCADEELEAHEQRLEMIDKISGGKCLWTTGL
ncbi:MAG: DNA polymerase III subunit epsilon [Methylococcales bacterium]